MGITTIQNLILGVGWLKEIKKNDIEDVKCNN